MAYYITVDSGTTNTRICLTDGKRLIDNLKFNVGASAGGSDLLKNTLKQGIKEIIENNKMSKEYIVRILASGMITSEFGLVNLEHITVPAGVGELHNSMKEVMMDDISDIPFVFIRGVKTKCSDLSDADMMRGEETELTGISDYASGECVYVLPGSHSKIIKTDKSGRITDFTTLLTGEMISALSENTILKNAVELKGSKLDEDYLLMGYDFCEKHGINKSLFKVRILKNIFGADKNRTYSFFVGAVLHGEIKEILKTNCKNAVISGQTMLKYATDILLKNRSDINAVCVDDAAAGSASMLGAVKIYEYAESL